MIVFIALPFLYWASRIPDGYISPITTVDFSPLYLRSGEWQKYRPGKYFTVFPDARTLL